MPLPVGWAITIADFQRVPDGSGAYSVLVEFYLTGPTQGTRLTALVLPAQVLACQAGTQPKRCILLAAWQQVSDFANNFIAASAAPAIPSSPDLVIGSTFSPP